MVRLNLTDALFCQSDLSCKYSLLVEHDKMFEAFVIFVKMYWGHLTIQLSYNSVTGFTVTMATKMKINSLLLLGNSSSRLWSFLSWCLNSVHDLDGWKRLNLFL